MIFGFASFSVLVYHGVLHGWNELVLAFLSLHCHPWTPGQTTDTRGKLNDNWRHPKAFPNGFPAIFRSFALDAYPRSRLSAHFSRRLLDVTGSANLVQAEPGTEREWWGAKAAKPCKTLISVRGFLHSFHREFGVISDILLISGAKPKMRGKERVYGTRGSGWNG